jgi:sporulation protein YlmC with PRC-barrel domain
MNRGAFFRREEIMNKSVYDLKGKYIGKVIDFGFGASGEAGLVVEVDKNKTEFFSFSIIQAISDIVLVQSKVTVKICPNCGSTVKPDASFCTNCGAKL